VSPQRDASFSSCTQHNDVNAPADSCGRRARRPHFPTGARLADYQAERGRGPAIPRTETRPVGNEIALRCLVDVWAPSRSNPVQPPPTAQRLVVRPLPAAAQSVRHRSAGERRCLLTAPPLGACLLTAERSRAGAARRLGRDLQEDTFPAVDVNLGDRAGPGCRRLRHRSGRAERTGQRRPVESDAFGDTI
jgi:hypothetical protein